MLATIGGGTGFTTVNAVNGVATFINQGINRVAVDYTLVASTVLPGGPASVTTNPFNVVPELATQFVVSSQPPSSVTANSPFSLTVTALDPSGNIDPSFTGMITLALSPTSTSTTFGLQQQTAINGVATFNGLSLNRDGTYTITATTAASGTGTAFLSGVATVLSATANSITVTSATATQLSLTATGAVQPPTSVTAGGRVQHDRSRSWTSAGTRPRATTVR